MIYDALVIGAGQAGLATGYRLQQAGLRFLILEAGSQPGGSWPYFYDSLLLNSPARYSSLPGLPFPMILITIPAVMKPSLIYVITRPISNCLS